MGLDKKFSVLILVFFLIGLSLGFVLSQNFYSPVIETSLQLPSNQENLDLTSIENLLQELVNKDLNSNSDNSTTLSIDLSNIETLLQELVNKDSGSVSLDTSGIETKLNQINSSLQSNTSAGSTTDISGIESELNKINNTIKTLETRLRSIAYYTCLDAKFVPSGATLNIQCNY